MASAPKILVINGPNLNMLGVREPAVYGRATLADIEKLCRRHARPLGLALDFRQSNHEGELITWLQESRKEHAGIIINAGAYTHTSIAILDALQTTELPVIEVHLSNIFRREEFRHHSYVSLAARAVICGLGPGGYRLALEAMAEISANNEGRLMPKFDVDESLVRKLAGLLEQTGLTEIEFEAGEQRIRVTRGSTIVHAPVAAAPAAAPAAATPAAAASDGPPAGAVTSPMVGTAYAAATPGTDVFVKVGDRVQKGQTLLIIEAMKVMNPIPAPHAGTVKEIFFDDGRPVEYGDVLMVVA